MNCVTSPSCKICNSPTTALGTRTGKHIHKDFELCRCNTCHFAFISNPHSNLDELYGDDYYAGKGADPLVDYEFELSHPDITIRQYEWSGIERVIRDSVRVDSSTRWLDFGCGTGGLVRYCRDRVGCQAFGYDASDRQGHLEDLGTNFITERDLEKFKGTFDVTTAIEVFEHLPDPVSSLRLIHSLLKPGGLFYCTTGNAQPFAKNILEWRYLIPEIHISLFEPKSLETALKIAGFRPEYTGFPAGFEDIMRFKILKNLGIRRTAIWEKLLPWPLLSRMADRVYKLSGHPMGRA